MLMSMDKAVSEAAGLELLLRAVMRLDGQLKRNLKREHLSATGTRWLPPANNDPRDSMYAFEAIS